MSNEETKFMTVAEFAARIGVHPQTIRKWDRDGTLRPHHVLPSGRRLYSEEQIQEIINNGVDDSE